MSIGLCIASCKGETKDPEVVSLEDLSGETSEEESDTLENVMDSTVILDTELQKFVHSQFSNYDTSVLDERHLLDRFTFSSRQKVRFKGKENVPYGKTGTATPKADMYYFTFSDSVKTNNAFYNYLDQMAPVGEGGPVKLLENVESIKMPPMQMFVYDTVIVSVHYTCEAVSNNWKPFQDSLLNYMGDSYRYRFDVDCGGPLVWEK